MHEREFCIKLQAAVPVAEYKSMGNETFARFFFLAKFPAEVYKLLSKLAWSGEGGRGDANLLAK